MATEPNSLSSYSLGGRRRYRGGGDDAPIPEDVKSSLLGLLNTPDTTVGVFKKTVLTNMPDICPVAAVETVAETAPAAGGRRRSRRRSSSSSSSSTSRRRSSRRSRRRRR
jgi:hypothetical protein